MCTQVLNKLQQQYLKRAERKMNFAISRVRSNTDQDPLGENYICDH